MNKFRVCLDSTKNIIDDLLNVGDKADNVKNETTKIKHIIETLNKLHC